MTYSLAMDCISRRDALSFPCSSQRNVVPSIQSGLARKKQFTDRFKLATMK
jgi:hypothetical protein